jgi:7,8-dihydropterin-6-yl-methyl-4-(beta-D-ribofuranosyl)aminobenzene 5'-phosphate synthase
MLETVSRREFLKYSLVATGGLAALTQASTSAAEPQRKIREVDAATVWTVTDNYYDTLRPDGKAQKRFRSKSGRSMHAEHGVSFFVETVIAGQATACMYDFGVDPVGVLNNLALLGIDPARAKAFSLSHGHWDHYTSAAAVLKSGAGRIAAGTPFFVGEEAFAHRYNLRPGSSDPADLGQLQREVIEAAGLKVVEITTPTEIVPGAYLTGPIDRATPYEKVPPTFQIRRGDRLEHDTFPGEQGLFFLVRGKGLVVLTGCGHVGIVNTVRHAQKLAGTEKLHAVVGGFHLANAKPELIQATVGDLKSLRPDLIVPTHCTGFEAVGTTAREMPNEFFMNTAGTQYTFAAPVTT